MLTDQELQDILYRIDEGIAHWRDRAKLRDHIAAQNQQIAALKQNLAAGDAELARLGEHINGWHTLQVRRVPVLGTVTGADAQVVFYEAVETGAPE